MTHRSPPPATIPPGRLVLRTEGACDLDPQHLLDVWARQRQRFAEVLRGFGHEDWAAPTRCADWSAHDVVRHLCDCNAIAAGAGPDDPTLDPTAGFDPRITPAGGRRYRPTSHPAPASAVSWQQQTTCSRSCATGWPSA